jgi:hypothetical protein
VVSFKSRWMDWEPETPKYETDKTDKRGGKGAFGGFVSSIVGDISPETADLTDVIPVREGTPLQRLAYEARDKQLFVECRSRAVELQAWLTAHFDEHMTTEPLGMPEWISAMAEFDIVERGQLRGVFHYQGCIHGGEGCPHEVPVNCTACEGRDD